MRNSIKYDLSLVSKYTLVVGTILLPLIFQMSYHFLFSLML